MNGASGARVSCSISLSFLMAVPRFVMKSGSDVPFSTAGCCSAVGFTIQPPPYYADRQTKETCNVTSITNESDACLYYIVGMVTQRSIKTCTAH